MQLYDNPPKDPFHVVLKVDEVGNMKMVLPVLLHAGSLLKGIEFCKEIH